MTIPLWKLNRELRRIGKQILGAPYLVFDIYERLMEPFWRYQHRKEFNARVSVDDGQIEETQRVVIFLIYQPNGVAQSTISLCENMIALGFSPFIVSNAPLSPTDRDRIDAVAWKVMERPNFGYDFGGYQDALFVLRDLKDTLEYLIIMNDSVWLEFTPDLWERLVAEDADVVGLIQEDKIHKSQLEIPRVEHRNLQSYFFVFRQNLWHSDVFWSYWQNYKMVSNKKRTIKIGEIGFSNYLIKHNVKVRGIISRKKFMDLLKNANCKTTACALKYAVYNNAKLAVENDAILKIFQSDQNWKELAYDHICKSLEREPLNGSYWVAVCAVFEINLIKKNKDPLYCHMREQYLSAYHQEDTAPLPADVLQELSSAVHSERNKVSARLAAQKSSNSNR